MEDARNKRAPGDFYRDDRISKRAALLVFVVSALAGWGVTTLAVWIVTRFIG